jgi:isoquinoline 1-oxidoreductase subunit alpha
MPEYSLRINGKVRAVIAEPDTPLLWVLRDELGLTGTKYGCGVGVCGACTVHENGSAVRSCQIAVAVANTRSFITIEGLSSAADHPCQKAWMEEDVAQCGFCQPGMIMEAAALLKKSPRPSDKEIDQVMSQHVCRCGTYQRIRAAIHHAAAQQGKKKTP